MVGRPNVGKSSLFNRLLHRRYALVDPAPGVTRDRLQASLTWRGRLFVVVDTGGLAFGRGSSLDAAIQGQVTRAIEEADLLLFVCDARTGPLPLDARIAGLLRASGKPVLVVAHKADTDAIAARAVEFHIFGFGPPVPISSSHGRGVGDLLDLLGDRLSASLTGLPPPLALTLAVVGRPNVGKSSFVNRLLREERVTVDVVPGTTRDAVEVPVPCGNRAYQVVDTAGVRARPKLKTAIDVMSVKRSLAAAERADGCLVLLDVSAGILDDDVTLLGRILAVGRRPCVVVMNKWDLVEAGNPEAYAEAFWRRAPFAAFVPVIAASAVTGYHVDEALVLATTVAERARWPLPIPALQAATRRLQETTDRPWRLRRIHFVRLRQLTPARPAAWRGVSRLPRWPLTLELTVRGRVSFHRPDLAFVERVVRSSLELDGVPIQWRVRVV